MLLNRIEYYKVLLSNAKGWKHFGPGSPRRFQGVPSRIWFKKSEGVVLGTNPPIGVEKNIGSKKILNSSMF